MAVRPLVTTGVALVSAGAIVAATPALFVPRDQITVAAHAPAPAKLTQEQINLLALSLQGAWQSFTQGYGGIYIPGQVPKIDTVTGEIVTDADGNPVMVDAPGDCTATGAVCQKGFTGLAYYLSDNILPLGPVDNIFFEGGFTALAKEAILVVANAIDSVDPTGRLDLAKRVNDFFDGGATKLVGNLLLDNLPQDGYAYGLTNSFFFGYGANTGIYAAFTYVVDAIAQGTPTPTPNLINPLDSGPSLLSTQEESNSDTVLLAKATTETETAPTSTGLPNFGKLLSLPTPNLAVESPWKKLTETLGAPAAPTLLKDVEGTQDPVETGTGIAPLDLKLPPAPEAPKFEPPKAPEFKLPEFKAPELKLPEFKAPEVKTPEVKTDITPKITIKDKEAAAEDEASTGADTKTGKQGRAAHPLRERQAEGRLQRQEVPQQAQGGGGESHRLRQGFGDGGDK